MKITWFGNTAFRIHAGGKIVVVDAEGAVGVDRTELVSGADAVVTLAGPEEMVSGPEEMVSGKAWKPMARQRLLDADGSLRDVAMARLGAGAIVLDAEDEPPLLVLSESVPELGRWADKSVVVIAGGDIAGLAAALTEDVQPRLIALAGPEAAIDAAFDILRSKVDGTGVVALESGLAVEA